MGVFTHADQALEWRGGHETVRIEPWGPEASGSAGPSGRRSGRPPRRAAAAPRADSTAGGRRGDHDHQGGMTAEVSASGS